MLTPEELKELRRLHIVAGRRVDSLFAGEYRSAVKGRGMEFEEVRPYVPGDDVRQLDWNVTARTNEPHIKVYREERQTSVLLVVDVSGSTRIGSGGRDGRTDRRLQIARIAGGIAYAGIRNRDRIGLVTFSDRVETYLSPRKSRGHAWAIIQTVYQVPGRHRGTNLEAALSFVHGTQRRRAVIVVVSDFLSDGPWARSLATLSRRHKVHAVLVHDPIDMALSGLGLLEVVDAETGRVRLVDAARFDARAQVTDRVRELHRLGAAAVGISTTDDAFAVLHDHFHRQAIRR